MQVLAKDSKTEKTGFKTRPVWVWQPSTINNMISNLELTAGTCLCPQVEQEEMEVEGQLHGSSLTPEMWPLA